MITSSLSHSGSLAQTRSVLRGISLERACFIAATLASLGGAGCDRPSARATPAATTTNPAPGSIAITVDAQGYHPATVQAQAGQVARLVFTRTSDEGCGQQLVFPTLSIRKDLPLNTPVTVEFPMPTTNVAFTCGMNMYRGSVVAR